MIAIIIPTISPSRITTLLHTVKSIQMGTFKDVSIIVVSDANHEVYWEAKKRIKNASVVMNEKRIGWPATINKMVKGIGSEYYCYASDDLLFPYDCLEMAMIEMKNRFPKGDGVVTIGKKPYATFGLFGSKFADRFPDRQIFCPDYFHYGCDSELMRTLKALKLHSYSSKRESQVKHFRLKDASWVLARRTRNRDLAMFKKRESLGLSWGIDFRLLSGKKETSENDSKQRPLEGQYKGIG